jgi:glycosyltransferase involved in cell wall biosynthesis
MRTLVVIHSLKMGGMERVAVNLADAFADHGHESHLLSCRSRPNDLAPANPAVKLHHFDQFRALMKSVIGIPVFLLSRLLLGVLLPRSHFMWVGWLSGWLLKRRIRAIENRYGQFDRIIFRGLGTYKYFWSFRDERNIYVLENVIHYDRPLWQKTWEWKLVFHNRHLACVSSGVMESAQEAFTKGDIAPKSLRVITNPCPVEQIDSLAQEPDADIPDEPYILNVARLVPQKGHELLLEAYKQSGISHKLVIVGEGLLKEKLEDKARALGIADRVLFAGKRKNPYPWMKRADLFVLASEYEGLGIVLTEALACVSSGVMESAEEAFAKGNIAPKSLRVITNHCPVEQIDSLAQETDPDIPDEPYILNVARLVPQKGHELLLEAYKQSGISHKLVIVGEGLLKEKLEDKARALGIADRVLFAGKRKNPYPWMKRADLFVLASEYEGLGIVLTEALACGTPIMAVESRGGVKDVFRGELEAFLTPRTVDGLANGLISVVGQLPITVKPEWLAPFRSEVVVSDFLEQPGKANQS